MTAVASEYGPEPVHEWFELTYANSLVLYRSALQSMPAEWQARFVRCLEELEERFGYIEDEAGVTSYLVKARGSRGRFVSDPYPHYNRGRTRLSSADTPNGPASPSPQTSVAGSSGSIGAQPNAEDGPGAMDRGNATPPGYLPERESAVRSEGDGLRCPRCGEFCELEE